MRSRIHPAPSPGPPPELRPEPYRIDLTQGSLLRGILLLVWPIMIASLLQTLVGFVDLLMIGHLAEVATSGIAAIGMSWKIMFVVMVLVFAISTGTQVVVSRSVGAGDHETARRATGQAFLILSLTIGLVLSPLGFLLARSLLRLTGAPPDVEEVGAPYLRIMFLAAPAMLTMFLFASSMQGAGDSRSPLVLTASVNIVNVFLNWVLIFGNLGFPQMGVTGAAWGTFIARSLGAVAALALLSSGRFAIAVRWRAHLRPAPDLWVRVFRIGIPSGLQGLVRAVSGWLVVRILATVSEPTPVLSGYAVAEQIMMLTAFIGFAAMPAGMTVVGQNMGAEQPGRAEAGGWSVVRLATIAILLPAAAYAIAAPQWVRLVGPKLTPEALMYGALALRVLALGEPAWAINMALAGALRGGGDTMSPLMYTIYTQLLMGIGGGALLVGHLGTGAEGLWGAILIAMWVQSFLTMWKFNRGEWKSLTV
jgi:MATE family multidrug resistance protein